MTEGEGKMPDQQEDLREVAARIYRERDRRIAENEERLAKEPVELPAYMQELIDTREEYQARMRAKLKWIVENVPF
jgi:hypothetical protein